MALSVNNIELSYLKKDLKERGEKDALKAITKLQEALHRMTEENEKLQAKVAEVLEEYQDDAYKYRDLCK